MQRFNNKGRFKVKITSYEVQVEDAENVFTLLLRGETEDDMYGIGRMRFSNQAIRSGKNAGKTWEQSHMETLAAIGVPDGDPANLDETIEKGLFAEFSVDLHEYNGKEFWEVKYINPVRDTIPMGKVNWNELMNKLHEPERDTPASDFDPGAFDKDELEF